MLSFIASLIEEWKSEFGLVISVVIDEIHTSSPQIRAIAFDTALILVNVIPSDAIVFLDLLLAAASASITSLKQGEKVLPKLADSAIGLWLALVRVYHLEVMEEDVAVALARIAFAGKTLIEEVISFITLTRFQSVIDCLTPLLAAVVLSSSLITPPSSEIFFNLAQFALLHPEKISQSLGHNQNALSKIQTRIIAILQPVRSDGY
jgi:hypothetical protein